MKKLFVSDDWLAIQQVAQLLDGNRIPYMVKNEFASGAVGELSPFDVQPEIWLLDDDWFAKANGLVEDLKHVVANGKDWTCSKCSEHNESSFEVCWQCGADSTDATAYNTDTSNDETPPNSEK